MRLLDRYVMRQFTGTFVGLMLGLPVLFIIGDITDKLSDYLARGLSQTTVALSYVYLLPQFVFWSLPIAGLVATVFTVGNMTRHQEITAAKAGGVSFYRLVAPLVGMAALVSLAAVVLGDLIPITNARRLQLLGEQNFSSSTLRTNFVFQSEGGRTLSVHRLDSEADHMTEVVLQREPTTRHPGIHVTALRAEWKPKRGWTMSNGFLRFVSTSTTAEQAFKFDSLRVASLTETPEELLAEPKEPEEMRYAEMTRYIRVLERSGGDARKLRVEQAQRVSLPLAVLVIVLFGAPLSTSSKRGGAAYGVGISLAVTMGYLMLFKVGSAIGQSGGLDPLVAAWMPNALFLLAGLYLLARVRT